MPWKLLMQSDDLASKELKLNWVDYPGGTGAMVEALNTDQLDMAVLLTEGAVKAIHDSSKFKILSFYVTSPLIWGIHVAANSPYQNMEDIKGKRYAISRYGSGSHIMSYVNARKRNWPVEKLDFALVNDLNGARTALKQRTADVFLWEKYTTAPYVHAGEFRRIGERVTPYDCFVIVASEKLMQSQSGKAHQVLTLLFEKVKGLVAEPSRVELIAEAYQLDKKLVAEWLSQTTWATTLSIQHKDLDLAKEILHDLELIQQPLSNDNLIWNVQ